MWFQVRTNFRDFYVEADDLSGAIRAATLVMLAREEFRGEVTPVPEFATVEAAEAHFWAELGDEDYVDNVRIGFEDDADSMAAFEAAGAAGCCGSFELTMIAGGRFMAMGCNYGH